MTRFARIPGAVQDHARQTRNSNRTWYRGGIVAHHDAGFVIHATWHNESTMARAKEQVAALIGKQPAAGRPFWGD